MRSIVAIKNSSADEILVFSQAAPPRFVGNVETSPCYACYALRIQYPRTTSAVMRPALTLTSLHRVHCPNFSIEDSGFLEAVEPTTCQLACVFLGAIDGAHKARRTPRLV